MQRTKLADRVLPDYTVGEEIMNMVTHIMGAAFGVVALILCVVFSAKYHDGFYIVGSSVYGASLIFLYTMSSVYHGLKPGIGKKVMQVIDHCTIFFLIGGTYTPIVLGPIREQSTALGWTIFGVVWGLCAMGTVFTAIDHNKYGKFSMCCYIGIGWVIVLAIKPTVAAVTLNGVLCLLLGGVAYTIGAILYSYGKKHHKRYVHSIFHIFVLVGTMFHFITVFKYCILG